MFSMITIASLPFLAQAAYLDPSLQQQKPLLDHKSATERVMPLTLNKILQYAFPSTSNSPDLTSLGDLQRLSTYSSSVSRTATSISIPLDPAIPGSATFIKPSAEKSTGWPQTTSHLSWVTSDDEGFRLGSNIPLLDIGIRKGGSITMDAESVRLDLGSAYTHVPKEIWDVLVMATRPEENEEGEWLVGCEKERYPDLVFGLDGEAEGCRGEEVDELVVRPEQYVMETEEGKCVLLVRNAHSYDDGGIVLGWAAMRGRDVVLDWDGGRVGFGK